MNQLPLRSPAHLIALAALCLATSSAAAQTPAAGQTAASYPRQLAQTAAKPSAENDWLAKISALYYSSTRAGLTGFDCDVHPDWHALIVSASKGAPVPDDDARIALLKTVKVTLHAHMGGDSTVDWVEVSNPDKAANQSSTGLLDGMHKSVQQTLEGFLQFWSPFMENTVVPDSAEGLEITHTPAGHTIHAKQGKTELTEIFNSDLVLEHFNVVLSGITINFAPAYKPTPQGLLVNSFKAHILLAGTAPDQAQNMTVDIDYQTVGGTLIPNQLNMDMEGTGKFDFAFDGCSAKMKTN